MSTKNPPIVIAYGNHVFLKRRFAEDMIQVLQAEGYEVQEVLSEDISSLLQSRGVLFQEKVLAVVNEPGDFDVKELYSFNQSEEDGTLSFLFLSEGTPKGSLGELLKLLPKQAKQFSEPPPYKREEEALKYLRAELHPLKATEIVLRDLVSRAGVDLGVLSFEALKLKTLCSALGQEEIKPGYIKHVVPEILESTLLPFMDSVGQRNAPGLLRLGGQIEKTHAGDPTIKVCAFLNNQILTWLKALSLKEQGLDAKTSAERLGIHPYPFSKDVLPQAETWGKTRLVQLLDLTCTAERNLKRGSVRPWVYLLSNLAKLCER